jgi:phospholipase A1
MSKSFRFDPKECLALVLFVSLLMSGPVVNLQAEGQKTLLDCSQIANYKERLACYDELARRKSGEAAPADGTPTYSSGDDSYLSQLWELDENKPRGQYALKTHRSNYIMPFTYNSTPNEQPIQDAIGQDVMEAEVTFQISQKIKLWQDVLGKDMDLWFGYTQRSFWQLYNSDDSAPFRETNYEPEALLNFRTDIDFLGMKARAVQVGFNHQSNGRSEPLSRSWNRIVGNVGFEKDNFRRPGTAFPRARMRMTIGTLTITWDTANSGATICGKSTGLGRCCATTSDPTTIEEPCSSNGVFPLSRE